MQLPSQRLVVEMHGRPGFAKVSFGDERNAEIAGTHLALAIRRKLTFIGPTIVRRIGRDSRLVASEAR